jgi:PAS domain S-box-containing protein
MMISTSHSVWKRYVVASLWPAVALAITALVRPFAQQNPFLLFWGAAALSAWYGGLLPGLLTALLSIIFANYFFMPPVDTLHFSAADVPRFAVFALVVYFVDRIRNSQRETEITQRFVLETSALLASSLDYRTTLSQVARLAVPDFADWCILDVVGEDGRLNRLEVIHAVPEKAALAQELKTRYPVLEPAQKHTLYKVIQSGNTWLDSHVSEVRLEREARDSEHYRLLKTLGFKSEIVVQMEARGKLLGAITLVYGDSKRHYRMKDLRIAEELARRAAVAVDNALLYHDAQMQRERLQVTLRSIGDGVIASTLEGGLTFMNPVAEQLTGWEEADALDASLEMVFQVLHRETRVRVVFPVEAMQQGQTLDFSENLLLAKDGRETPIDHSVSPIRDALGTVQGLVLIMRDVSARLRAEQELADLLRREQDARAEAEEANALKLKFLAMISHELRTPLTSIKGFVSSLLATDVMWSAEQQRDFLQTAEGETDKLTDLVEHLLDLSRMHAGTLRILPEPQPLVSIVNTARAQLQMLTARHELVLALNGGLPDVLADGQRIAQVIVNLVDNAVKYSPPHTRITLGASPTAEGIQISVSDEGEGIAPDDRQLVFETFHQVTRKSRQKGAGLGLAICKGLVEAHGGRIWIEERDGPGTTICFTLPTVAAPAQTASV